MKGLKRMVAGLGLLTLLFPTVAARRSSEPLVATSSAAIAVAVEDEVRCVFCEQYQTVVCVDTCVYTIYHRFTGDACRTGGDASVPSTALDKLQIMQIAGAVSTGDGDGFYCVSCGGTSDCHTDEQQGRCHVTCQSGGEVNHQREALETALRFADAGQAAVPLRKSSMVVYNAGRNAIQVFGCDGKRVVEHIPLVAEFAHAIETALSSN